MSVHGSRSAACSTSAQGAPRRIAARSALLGPGTCRPGVRPRGGSSSSPRRGGLAPFDRPKSASILRSGIALADLEPIPEASARLLIGNQSASEVEQAEMVRGDSLPAHKQAAKSVEPGAGSFNDPAPRTTVDPPEKCGLAAFTNMGCGVAAPDLAANDREVVALVEADVAWSTRTPRTS